MDYRIELEITSCAECGAVFGLIPSYHLRLKQKGKPFYCPNGHQLSFGDGENKKLKDKLERTETRLENETKYTNQQEKTISNLKGQITKLKKK